MYLQHHNKTLRYCQKVLAAGDAHNLHICSFKENLSLFVAGFQPGTIKQLVSSFFLSLLLNENTYYSGTVKLFTALKRPSWVFTSDIYLFQLTFLLRAMKKACNYRKKKIYLASLENFLPQGGPLANAASPTSAKLIELTLVR